MSKTRVVGPVFVGGTGRSGTHVVGHLLGAHSRYFLIPREAVFHSSPKGLPGFIRGTVSREDLMTRLRGEWWKRRAAWDTDVTRGLHKTLDEKTFQRALRAFSSIGDDDRLAASRVLLHEMFDPLATRAGKPSWVEMSPTTVFEAACLGEIFPELRLVHVTRNGLDSACSQVRLPWGPTSIGDALLRWAELLERAAAAAKAAGEQRVLTIALEDLVMFDRPGTYRRLLTFLDLPDEPGMRSFFAREVTAQRAHIGRWREELSDRSRREASALYQELRARLRDAGVDSPAAPPSAVSHRPNSDEPPNPLDPWADGRAMDA